MGKTLVYVVLLGVLGFGVYYFLVRNKEGLYEGKDANFTLNDTSIVGKVFLVETDGRSITAERNENNTWIINKKYPALQVQILNILTCMRLQTALTPVSDKDHDRVIKLLVSEGTKVEVYDREGNKIRSFTVAGQGPNYHGSYMIMENADEAYLVEIPGFEGYLAPRYSTELNEWRSRTVFDLPADSISDVTVNYPDEPLNSYTVKNTSSKPELVIDPALNGAFGEVSEKRLKDYLGFFSKVNMEGYLNDVQDMDSLIRISKLRCKISVSSKKGVVTPLDVYWIDLKDREKSLIDQTSTDPSHRPMSVERMYAVNTQSHDTLLIQARTFDKLFRVSYEFFPNQDIRQKQQMQNAPIPFNKDAPIKHI